MGSGYVLNFTDRTFQEFLLENIGIDIFDEKYSYRSGSKANRLRAFWKKESNLTVAKFIFEIMAYWKAIRSINGKEMNKDAQSLLDKCFRIANRLKQDSPVENIDAIRSNIEDRDFSLLVKSIRESINKNEPETGLDRLHTFVVKYIRKLCEKHNIKYDMNKPLHSIFGQYVKYLKQNRMIETDMTARILKMSISIMESFNDVRNKQSLAHDNPILNYNESILIFNNVSSTIRFIETIEAKLTEITSNTDQELDDDLPF